MAQTPTKEELVAKYGSAFQGIKDLSFGVEFPDGQKSVLRPLSRSQYRALMQTLEKGIKGLEKAMKSQFDVYDGDIGITDPAPKLIATYYGDDVTKPAKPQWILDEDGSIKLDKDGIQVPKCDEYGEQIFVPFPNIRIKVSEEDIKEFPRDRVRVKSASHDALLKAWGQLLWDNAQKILQLVFPDDASRFGDTYIDKQINVPFLITFIELLIDMNGLEFLIPFLTDFFPALGLLFGDRIKKMPKQTQATG